MRAWALGVFCGAVGRDDAEIRIISVGNEEKTYQKLEIHDSSVQTYAVLEGSVASPVASEPESKAVKFCRASAGEAIILNAKVWHGGPVGIDIPAKLVVILKKGTSESDARHASISPTVTFCLLKAWLIRRGGIGSDGLGHLTKAV